MDNEMTIVRNTCILMTAAIALVRMGLMGGVTIHEYWVYAVAFYIALFSVLVAYYDFFKNRRKRLVRKIEYVRLFAGFLFVIAFTYNVFFV